jgi:hypothetical protein
MISFRPNHILGLGPVLRQEMEHADVIPIHYLKNENEK